MIIRRYQAADCDEASVLFFETVHAVNAKDYTEEQLFAWVNGVDGLKVRSDDLIKQNTLIAELDGRIIGFGSIDGTGYLDLLFVHKHYQRQGVATALCNALEKGFEKVTVHSSITAKPFFENRGYMVEEARCAVRGGVSLKNFKMIKYFTAAENRGNQNRIFDKNYR